MELLYVWIEDYLVLKNIGFNFSNRYQIKDDIDVDKKTIKLELIERGDYVRDFFPKGILSVTAVVGENGVGKSTLLDFINLINHRPDLIGTSWLAVYYNHSKDKSELWGNLATNNQKWTLQHNESLMGEFNNVVSDNFEQGAKTPPIISIFYNPSLDLKDYGKSLNDVKAGLVNVSTNYLLEKDWEEKNTDETNVDQILNHRFKNVYRQFALSQLDTSIRSSLNIPNQIEVRFNKNRRIKFSDLSFSAKDIFEYLSEFGRNNAQIINDEILNAGELQKAKEFKIASLKKVKHWFLVNLLENYYSELTKWFDFEKKQFNQQIKREDFQNKSFFESIEYFFQMQNFVKSTNYSISKFIEDIFNLIDSSGSVDLSRGDLVNDSFFILPIEYGIQVHKANFKYRSLYRSNSNNKNLGFLDFNWRDVSNGEKARLDLFSRLYDGYRDVQNQLQASHSLYIVIDEGELGFHPQWQKEYLYMLLKFITEAFKGSFVQLILTSHSPFVLSDLPKSNVILLNKDKAGKTFVDHLLVKEQTFAANIHELFSDSFFMKNGTLGDFAKSKIEYLVALLGSSKQLDELEKARLKKLIQLIGEPMIKDRLLDMYREKFTDKETIEEKIARLKSELKNAEDSIKK
jgi:predicted ATPase